MAYVVWKNGSAVSDCAVMGFIAKQVILELVFNLLLLRKGKNTKRPTVVICACKL